MLYITYHFFLLQRIDLRDNIIQMRGMHALANVMKKNKTITQIDLDDKPRIRIVSIDTYFTCLAKTVMYNFILRTCIYIKNKMSFVQFV